MELQGWYEAQVTRDAPGVTMFEAFLIQADSLEAARERLATSPLLEEADRDYNGEEFNWTVQSTVRPFWSPLQSIEDREAWLEALPDILGPVVVG